MSIENEGGQIPNTEFPPGYSPTEDVESLLKGEQKPPDEAKMIDELADESVRYEGGDDRLARLATSELKSILNSLQEAIPNFEWKLTGIGERIDLFRYWGHLPKSLQADLETVISTPFEVRSHYYDIYKRISQAEKEIRERENPKN